MKKYNIILKINLFVLITFIGVIGCKPEIEDLSAKIDGLGGTVLTKTTTDNWLNDNFTKPFNIEVKYRWDPFEVPLDKTLVPPLVDKVRPTMEAVKAIWIDPYIKEAGADFIKKYCPKQYILVGSANWNNDGTITLGTAEGGRKVVLYQINDFEKKNVAAVKQMLHTIHHEFGHILNQNILYSVAFKQITPGSYTSNWYNISEEEALSLGYVTSYAMSSPDEDFVEMLATMLVEGKTAYDARVATASATAQESIRRKEQIVIDYMNKAYNINFRSLQTTTQEAIANITK
jgi:substrate import-associated zinc metallohydrolase lipoprotein